MAKKLKLELGRQIEVLTGTIPPTVEDPGGRVRPMTVGDLLLRVIPVSISHDTQNAVRLWRIAMEIDKAQNEALTLSDLDFELLKKAVLASEQPVWIKVNLDQAFADAKE